MNYNIAVCDDQEAERNYLSALVNQWSKNQPHAVQISAFSSAENFLFQYEDKKDYDILLLDIEMGQMNGVEMAKVLRKENEKIQIIFVTGYSDYISEGYEVEALHYLMKPVKEEKLWEVLDRAADKLSRNEKMLNLESGGGIYRIPVYQIRYAEVYGNYVTIHAMEEVRVKMTLRELEEALDERFLRVSRSFIVNLTRILRVTKKEILLNDGTALPLPRGAYEQVNRAIINMR